MFAPDWLSKLRYEIFQIGEVAGEIFLVAYGIKKGFRKLWPDLLASDLIPIVSSQNAAC